MKNVHDNSGGMNRYKSVKDVNKAGIKSKKTSISSGSSVLNACIHHSSPFDEVGKSKKVCYVCNWLNGSDKITLT
jgi:hypothetical protein